MIPITPRKEKALQALLVSRTRAEAARAAGIGESTLRGYLQDPEFSAAYKKAAAGIMDGATRQLQQNLTAAIDRLAQIVADDEENSMAQISAAKQEIDNMRQGLVEEARQKATKELYAIVDAMRQTYEEKPAKAPTQEQLAVLQALKMRDSVSKDELREAVGQMMESQTAKISLTIENDVTKKINLIYEKLDGIDEKLKKMPTPEDLAITNGRIEVLEAIVKKLSREVAELKKAQ